MKFKLSTSGHFYPAKDKRTELSKLGFTFKPSDYREYSIEGTPEIEINTLEELIEFSEKYGGLIIEKGYIEIYDTYRE